MILIQTKGKIQLIVLKKNYFKLIKNNVFGKAMDNLRKRMSVKLVSKVKYYVKCISKPIFVSQKVFSKNFVANHEIKPVLILDKPVYVGFGVLDLSKLLMYEFHYEDIKSKFDANCCLLIQTV